MSHRLALAFVLLVAARASATSDPGWLARAGDALARAEYAVSPSDGGLPGHAAPNRAHDLRARWVDGRLTVSPRVAGGAWSFTYELVRVGRDGAPPAQATLRWTETEGGRLDWNRGDVVETYVNDERGLEQVFTIARRPEGRDDAPVVLEGLVAGLLAFPSEDGQAILLRTSDGVDALRVSKLLVTDARGTRLPSCMTAGDGRISILVDDRAAQYPVTVDPLLTNPAWTAEADQESAALGTSVATAGDVNGDGYADVIVGAFLFDAGEANEGIAHVFFGSAAGLGVAPSWSFEGNQADASLGRAVASAGDVNGDGFADVMVGAPGASNGQPEEGRAYVFHGSPSGPSAAPSWTVESNQGGANFGRSLAPAGDVNGDGFSDVLVGAHFYNNGQSDEGRAYAYHGSAGGLATTPAWLAESDQANAQFGWSLSTAGDVNGDGFSDVIVGGHLWDGGQTNEGRAWVYLGSPSGLGPAADWDHESDEAGAFLGVSVGTAGDVNGDGYADVVVGAERSDGGQADEGRAFVFLGSATGLADVAAWTGENDQGGAAYGRVVGVAGDVNGDGYSDILVAAPFGSLGVPGILDPGLAFLYPGSPSGPALAWSWRQSGGQSQASYGASLGTAGDVDGDGYSDVIIGAPAHDAGETNEGRAFTYMGSAAGLSQDTGWDAQGGQAGAHLGLSVASAGDVNGDGFGDVIVGAADFDDGQSEEGRAFVFHGSSSGPAVIADWTADGNQQDAAFGWSVASAGDVNGDGYGDVIVGAPGLDDEATDQGRAFAYLGSPAGLATSGWTVEGDQDGAELGTSVASAGDVNGDGFSDVIVGEPGFTDSQAAEGGARVYHGSANGLAASPAWTAAGGATGARFGGSVA